MIVDDDEEIYIVMWFVLLDFIVNDRKLNFFYVYLGNEVK